MTDPEDRREPLTVGETAAVLRIEGATQPLYPYFKGGFMEHLLRKEPDAADAGASARKGYQGRKMHPFDMRATAAFKNSNGYHSTCIETKVNSSVGMGFVSDKVEDVLGPLASVTGLCHSFSDVLVPVCDDFVQNGNGYIEVVREKPGGAILGLHHLEAAAVYVTVEDDGHNIHYEVLETETTQRRGDEMFPKFGDSIGFDERVHRTPSPDGRVSEIIHFSRRSALSRWYGWPDWLSAVAAIELTQMMHQQQFDFYLNRGVPEFMLFIMGKKLPDADWKVITNGLKAQIGLGNSHKSLAINIADADENTKVQLEKLAMEGKANGEDFASMHETLALEIVSAHRIPPLLAGIVIPGKLGANNELPNALMATQALVVGPMQFNFQTTLGATLGNPKLNGGLGLVKKDFEFKKITEEIDLSLAATVGGMKQPLAEANAQGRDLKAGLKKELPHLSDEDIGYVLGAGCSLALRSLVARRGAAQAA